MILRSVTENELAKLATIDAQANRSPWSLLNYQQSIQQANQKIIGIYDLNDELLGACVYSHVLDEGEILQLCIRKEQQRNGYAYHLLNQICNDLQTRHISQLFLEVMISNLPAINLYQKLGFNVISTRKNYYNVNGTYIDALLMAKQL